MPSARSVPPAALIQEGDAHEDDAAGNGHPAKERLEGEDGEEEDRRPGEVEEDGEGGGGDELLNRFEIAEAGGRGFIGAHGGFAHHGFKHAVIEA